MIQNDIELKATQERITWIENLVAQFRVAKMSQEEFKLMSGGYLAEVEKMHAEVMEYLSKHSSETKLARTA